MSVSEETSKTTVCKNCEKTFEGRFCPNCSQRADTHRFTLNHITHEFLHALTHTDKGIFYLIKEMFLRPGKVAREFNAGKRKKYFSPVTFLLITTALSLFLSRQTNFYDAFVISAQKAVQQLENMSPDKNEYKRSSEKFEEFRIKTPKILENTKVLTMLLIPVIAFFTWLFFKKSGFNYAENVIFNILVLGQVYVFFIIFCIPIFLIYPPSILIVFYSFFTWSFIYSIIAYKQFYQQRTWVTIIKGIAVQLLYYFVTEQITNAFINYV
jgi:hypothetical protein